MRVFPLRVGCITAIKALTLEKTQQRKSELFSLMSSCLACYISNFYHALLGYLFPFQSLDLNADAP